MSHDKPYGYQRGVEDFKKGVTMNPFHYEDENYVPWIDGWYDAFNYERTR